ncbi:MAG: NADH-dependent flavin oxidoreductase, partial [Gammaproteobacteria bacterium]
MTKQLDKLFSPFVLNGHVLKNRIGVAPMTRMSSPGGSIPRQDVLDFLVRRAQNGVSLVYTEALITDTESAQGYPGQARLLTQNQIDAWKPVTAAIRAAGSVSIAQLFHCGRMSWPEVNPAHRVIAPSAIAPKQTNPLTGQPYPVPEEMTQADIDQAVQGFVQTTQGAIAAGFDGVEIHGAHGYLINEFLSSYSNQRTDGYGGSVENRYRFAHEVIQAVRKVVPKNKILSFRISNWGVADMEVSLFTDKQEWQQVIKLLSQEPLDAISVSAYDSSAKAFGTDQTMAQLTREVTPLPVIICGKIHDRATSEA